MVTAKNPVWMLLQDLFSKKGVTEVAINGPGAIFVEKDHRFFQLDTKITVEQIFEFVKDVADQHGRTCDATHPIFDGRLITGQRINIICPPYAHPAPVITIRMPSEHLTRLDEDPQMFGLSVPWTHFLKALVQAKANIIVAGGTSSGKTTLLNVLLQELPRNERVITIEETQEIRLSIPNAVALEAVSAVGEMKALSMRELVRNTLRMRPDRIIIGEVRGGEIFDLLQSMNTGHEGSMASIHANSANDALTRMVTLCLLSGIEMPVPTIKRQMAGAIHFIIQLLRGGNGERYISEILEITGMEGDNILSQKIAVSKNGKLTSTGITPKMQERLKQAGLPSDFFTHL